MANGWTPERRAKHAEAIKRWKPWEKSTGPKTPEGKVRAARNGDPGGAMATARTDAQNLRRWVNQVLREHRELMDLLTDLKP